MKKENIKKFVEKMEVGDISTFLKMYCEECYRELMEMGVECGSFENYVEDFKCNIDDVL